MDEVEVKAAADRLEAEYAQQQLAGALRRKSEADLERHSTVSPCTPPPKVLSPAGGSGVSRRCSLLASNDTPSLSAAGIALALFQRRVRVHFLAVFYLQRLTPPPYPRIYAILSPELRTETVTAATAATAGRAAATQGLAGATVTHSATAATAGRQARKVCGLFKSMYFICP